MPAMFRRGVNSAIKSKRPLTKEIESTSRAVGVKGLIRQSIAFVKRMPNTGNLEKTLRNQDRVLEAGKKGYLGAKKS